MLFDAGEPLQNPVLLEARVAALTAMLEERTGAVARLQGEREIARRSSGVVDPQAPATERRPASAKPPQRNRGALPPHLPRVEVVVYVEDKCCPCCGGAMHVIGEDVAEMLDVVPTVY
jgi:zinc-finger binding domain of transposase IS66